MDTFFMYSLIGLCAVNLILLIVLLIKHGKIEKDEIEDNLRENARLLSEQESQLEGISEKILRTETIVSRTDPILREEFGRSRGEIQKALRENREELSGSLNEIRETIERRLRNIADDNSKKLEEMRKTVDEKLQDTMEKRFNESFKMISERLEQVHRGLGEMQNLAAGVGDLKRVLTNVKTRGNLGEIQLAVLLEQILAPDQFIENATVKPNTQERVEFAVKLPGNSKNDADLLLPIDSKFPIEDFQRLLDAQDTGENLDSAGRQFETSVKRNAKNICSKYINPPITTDFAIMFVPTEGLYAEILRRPGLFECLQRDYKITVVGPTNMAAFLSSLHMGFRTLAIEKRSSEVWDLLGGVKTEFGKFGTVLDRVKTKLSQAANEIDNVGVRTRAIERKLRDVEELPASEEPLMIEESNPEDGE